MNFLKSIFFQLKYGRSLISSGCVQVKINKTSSAKLKEAYLGVPIMGSISQPNVQTILSAEKNSRLELSKCSIGRGSRIQVREGAKLEMQEGSYISDNSLISSSTEISIGKNCSISWEVQIFDDDGHQISGSQSKAPIHIGNNVWIGSRVTILKGSRIGNGCVVAAGAVVSGQFPDHSLIGGVPAKIIKSNIEWKNQ